MKRITHLFVVLMLLFAFANAQTSEKKWALGLYGGKNEYNGDLGNAVFNFNKAFYGFGGISLSRYLNPSFNLGLQGNYGTYGYYKDSETRNLLGKKTEGILFLDYKFNNGYILKEEAKLAPFLSAGAGIAGYEGDRIIGGGNDFIFPVGAGLKYQISDAFGIQYKFTCNFTNEDKRDYVVEDNNDRFAEQTLGIIFSFGKKDSDRDGVADHLDKCPGTPKGVMVNEHGCPIDADNDGIPDYLDECPGTPAGVKVDAKGCPVDSDGDGVPDYLDKCPNTPRGEKVDERGCPADTDGDGVFDYMDECPGTPEDVKVDSKGCPVDSDGDGVADYLDKCPDTPKGVKVDAQGCPLDRDGDGIPDYLDKCPDVPGTLKNKGCPEVKEETKKIFDQALQGIQFETAKAVIKPSSYSILDKVVQVMKDNPEYDLEINGHTDNVGDDAMNMELSQNRADAVKQYLIAKGIDAVRMTAKGFGETQPVEDNSTAAGRAKNRRVEFKVVF